MNSDESVQIILTIIWSYFTFGKPSLVKLIDLWVDDDDDEHLKQSMYNIIDSLPDNIPTTSNNYLLKEE